MRRNGRIIVGVLLAVLCFFRMNGLDIYAEEEKLSIAPESVSLQVGKTKTVTVTGNYKKLTWTSENEKVATVNTKGKITANNEGTTTVTATSEDNTSVSCKVKVIPRKIRVLLRTDGFSNIYHTNVILTSNKAFTISNGSEKRTYKAKESVTIDKKYELLKNASKITVTPKSGGKITIKSIKRNQGNPTYRGTLVIRSESSGLAVINNLPLEEYLYGVVGSEMSESFPKEALKTQAVTARSFAYAHMNSDKYKSLGADLDDSNAYQVYNNIKESSKITNAVEETENQVIKDGKKIISAYYFATSFGETSLPSEVWGGKTEDAFYNSIVQIFGGKTKNLSTNSKFKKFIDDKKIELFDRKSEWYRWSSNISKANLQKRINEKIMSCCMLYPKYIKKLQPDGSYASAMISTVGTLKNVTVVDRENSGMVKSVKIKGSKCTVLVESVTAAKILLATTYGELKRQNASTLSNLYSLPSSYFSVSKVTSGSAVTYDIQGGGYGHNVGMSQNGAKQMAKDGYEYTDILKHYYNVDVLGVTE
ncbi:MAG: SpoIID/LytB domain-containing protein [Lachnospiraceae bacterium]|nr:SpoIID/LytB domain-containing protein [Lachnospiraceae bacterium]